MLKGCILEDPNQAGFDNIPSIPMGLYQSSIRTRASVYMIKKPAVYAA